MSHRHFQSVLMAIKFTSDNFVNFDNTFCTCITKICDSKILVFYNMRTCIFSMSLFKYFKPVFKKSSLPSPTGNLSHTIPSSSIAAANNWGSIKGATSRTEYPGAQSVSSAT